MKTVDVNVNQPGRTFLKSTSHVRVLDSRGNYLRSVLVGLQFGIVHLPYEIAYIVIWPLFRNTAIEIFNAGSNLIFVLQAAFSAICTGFKGVLDATDELEIDEE